MSSFGSQLRKRLKELRQLEADVPSIMARAAEGATVEAVRVATENTPPNGAEIRGTNTRSGQMAQHWTTDSKTIPIRTVGGVQTTLANNMQYASYVNDGHRMDKHFVPGLILNNGLLEKVDPSVGGIMVGTKTEYVEGRYMKEKAIGKYKTTVRKAIDKEIREAFK